MVPPHSPGRGWVGAPPQPYYILQCIAPTGSGLTGFGGPVWSVKVSQLFYCSRVHGRVRSAVTQHAGSYWRRTSVRAYLLQDNVYLTYCPHHLQVFPVLFQCYLRDTRCCVNSLYFFTVVFRYLCVTYDLYATGDLYDLYATYTLSTCCK